jgi:hypothetical protein
MVPFAGWGMPIQYKDSIMESTVNCRQNGSLFDVSHMCGLSLKGKDCIPFLEKLVIADVAALAPGTGTLTVFTNEKGGAIDDSVITKVQNDHMYIVVNAGCRDKDLAHIEAHMKSFKAKGGDVSWHIHDERSLLALQVSFVFLSVSPSFVFFFFSSLDLLLCLDIHELLQNKLFESSSQVIRDFSIRLKHVWQVVEMCTIPHCNNTFVL